MRKFYSRFLFLTILFFLNQQVARSQNVYVISGIVTDTANQPVAGATIHLSGLRGGTITKNDGSFIFTTHKWSDTLQVTHTGFETLSIALNKGYTTALSLQMTHHQSLLNDVVIKVSMLDKEPGKRFMKKVIANKLLNDPDRFSSYSYKQYKRHELDVKNLDTAQTNGKGLKNLAVNIYRSTSSGNANSSILPIYFSETISNKYHNISPAIEKENILAKKKLGLQTDDVLRKLDKFNFNFNIYDNWLSIFTQTYASPLSTSAFDYYNFYFSDSSVVNGKKQYQIHFAPKGKYERAFTGSLWINDSTYSISKIDMRLSSTANLNFVHDIHYIQEYQLSLDSTTNKLEYMPARYSSIVDFETGLALLGIPVKNNAKSVRLIIDNTVVIDHIKFNEKLPDDSAIYKMNEEVTAEFEKDNSYWKQNRSDSLSQHEKDIYRMVDSLNNNKKYKFKTKIIAALGIDFLDIDNKIRIGPLTSIISSGITEGVRSRIGFWTMPGISKKLNVNAYVAYGTKDKLFKGHIGLQYIHNAAKWTKTSLSVGSDYNYPIEKNDELDEDNLLASMLRKNIPVTDIFVRNIVLKHEQYITGNLRLKASLEYKELLPIFQFSYHPIDNATNLPIDSLNRNKLPVAEGGIGLRFTKDERITIFNYSIIRLDNFNPILTANFIYGLEAGKAQFSYRKINVGIEQKLRLPPKIIFYYKFNAGKTIGTAPYLLLDVPAGNESHVDSKYLFNTMLPYEFAADEYLELHTRLDAGGMLFDKIPLLNKMGLRETLSFNMYTGSMTTANKSYNGNSQFLVTGNKPFAEAGVGVENLFHLVSINYFWRLTPGLASTAKQNGLFFGLKVVF
ncbi:DUF5686 and carboxypeptidase-like regulatory domain-containing protein [soil metagenome]